MAAPGRQSPSDSTVSAPRIISVGTGVSPTPYSQQELLDRFQLEDPRVRSIFLKSSIKRRYLILPSDGPDGLPRTETQGELLRKHVEGGLVMARTAVLECLDSASAQPADVRYLCCVSSTGFITPGFSALLIKELGLSHTCSRVDVVGMGCNAGLNALTTVTGWAAAHPGSLALMVCIEVCSAAYVFDGTLRSAVVNCLFGDGSAAVAVTAAPPDAELSGKGCPAVLRYASLIIPEASGAMRYDWEEEQGKFSFFLDPQIPYVIGAHAEEAVDNLLASTGLRRSDIDHWIVHSGGKKVIDAVRVNLRLTRYDVRHTTGVLADFGNLSSASFLFSYRRLLADRVTRPGDHGVLMTMGPGSTIETALLRW